MLALLAALLPVVACPTTDGIDGSEYPPLPAKLEVTGDPSLAVYAGAFGAPPFVLAPRGWRCEARIGADATAQIVARHGRDRVELLVIPGCMVCRLGVACPYFPDAAAEMREEYPTVKCRAPRRGMRAAAPDLVRSRSGFVLHGGRGTAEARCTLGARCAALLDPMLKSVRKALRQ